MNFAFEIPKLDEFPAYRAAAFEYRKATQRRDELGKIIPKLRIGTPWKQFPSRVVGGSAAPAPTPEQANIVTRPQYNELVAENEYLWKYGCEAAEKKLHVVQTEFSRGVRPGLIPTYRGLIQNIAAALDGIIAATGEERAFAQVLNDEEIASDTSWPEPLARFIFRQNIFDDTGRIDYEHFAAEVTTYGYLKAKKPKAAFVCPKLLDDPDYVAAFENLEKLKTRSAEISGGIASIRTTENPRLLAEHGFNDSWNTSATALIEREKAELKFVTPEKYNDITGEQNALYRDIKDQERILRDIKARACRRLAGEIFPHYAQIVQWMLAALEKLAVAVDAEFEFADAMFQADVSFGAPLERVRLHRPDQPLFDYPGNANTEYFLREAADYLNNTTEGA